MAKRYVSNKDESVPLFENKYLDKFTYVHPAVPLILFVPVVSYFLYKSANYGLSFPTIIVLFLTGIFVWTFTEYAIHRFVFHYEPKSNFGQYIHHISHGIHHDYPRDSRRLVMPPVISIPLALFFYWLFSLIIDPVHLAPFYSGFVFGYICYDMIHYATHHFPMKGPIGLYLKHHHSRHHYQNEKLGFGVSSPLWDFVFGTNHPRVEKPKRKPVTVSE